MIKENIYNWSRKNIIIHNCISNKYKQSRSKTNTKAISKCALVFPIYFDTLPTDVFGKNNGRMKLGIFKATLLPDIPNSPYNNNPAFLYLNK